MKQFVPSFKSQVEAYLKSEIERHGGNVWLLNMGYEACNDYASVSCQILTAKHGRYFRFETVARYIRAYKVALNNTQGVS